MPTGVEAAEQLSQYISEVRPELVNHELEPLLQYGGRSLLARTVRATGLGPSDEILTEITGAIDRMTNPHDQGILADKAVDTIKSIVRGEDSRGLPLTAGMVSRLTAHGEHLASRIQDPRSKAWSLMYLADAVSQQIPGRENVRAQAELAYDAVSLIDIATEAARQSDEDPAYTLQHLAWHASQTVAHAREFTDRVSMDDPEFQSTWLRLGRQNQDIYREAIQATDEIEDPDERYKQKAATAISIIDAIAITGPGLFSTNARLMEMVRTQVSEVIEGYETDETIGLTATQKCRQMVDFGFELAKVMGEKYDSAEQVPIIQHNLGSFVTDLFDAALKQAQTVRQSRNPLKSRLSYEEQVRDAGYYAANAAWYLVNNHFETALDVYAKAFKLERIEEKLDPDRHRRSNNDVIESIGKAAKERQDVEQGFTLLILADRLERTRLPKGRSSFRLEVNARVGLQYASDTKEDEDFAIENMQGGPEFVKWMVQVATSDSHTSWGYNLNALAYAHIKDPAFRKIVESELDVLIERKRQAEAPKSEAARLAEQITGPR